ncbi:intradiol ring-cleavage dioxygenase [Leucobacter sp. CSA1]|uniref:Intradiol ring-cleavage dioxygenase n=1 Tax=Leucobacter chromiisoli TaxID=2796471 RepID=A0A934USV7_9MICO|nr:intradiol ring-cleavage dioxygenase [Leucobacter chromiisoli]MBK0417709.1 intradiol ring-cleavage dioxygenase [Leucobacter chromiisoli]
MTFPEPQSTPEGLRYEGRLLAHQDEEVVDQGLRFDVTTLLSRRSVLAMFGIGAASLGLAACSSGSTASARAAAAGEIPEETAGPYPGDGSNGVNVLQDTGIVRSDIRPSIDGGATAEGVPMTLTLQITDQAQDRPFEGVAVYVWQCDRDGGYSMYSEGLENVTYLRGVQVADADGKVAFTSIFPACYSGRWPHIHFEVYPDLASITDSANAIATSQVALPEEICSAVYRRSDYPESSRNLAGVSLENDNVFGDDGGELQMATVSGDESSGYEVGLAVLVDTRTEAGGGGSAPGGGGSAPGGGSGPGGGSAPGGAPGSAPRGAGGEGDPDGAPPEAPDGSGATR